MRSRSNTLPPSAQRPNIATLTHTHEQAPNPAFTTGDQHDNTQSPPLTPGGEPQLPSEQGSIVSDVTTELLPPANPASLSFQQGLQQPLTLFAGAFSNTSPINQHLSDVSSNISPPLSQPTSPSPASSPSLYAASIQHADEPTAESPPWPPNDEQQAVPDPPASSGLFPLSFLDHIIATAPIDPQANGYRPDRPCFKQIQDDSASQGSAPSLHVSLHMHSGGSYFLPLEYSLNHRAPYTYQEACTESNNMNSILSVSPPTAPLQRSSLFADVDSEAPDAYPLFPTCPFSAPPTFNHVPDANQVQDHSPAPTPPLPTTIPLIVTDASDGGATGNSPSDQTSNELPTLQATNTDDEIITGNDVVPAGVAQDTWHSCVCDCNCFGAIRAFVHWMISKFI